MRHSREQRRDEGVLVRRGEPADAQDREVAVRADVLAERHVHVHAEVAAVRDAACLGSATPVSYAPRGAGEERRFASDPLGLIALPALRLRADAREVPQTRLEKKDGMLQATLDNGLEVILVEDHSAPVVALNVWVRVGSADERDEQWGMAHVHEHMLFKGTERRGVGEIASHGRGRGREHQRLHLVRHDRLPHHHGEP